MASERNHSHDRLVGPAPQRQVPSNEGDLPDGYAAAGEPAKKLAFSNRYGRQYEAIPDRYKPRNEDELTAPLMTQRKLLRELIGSGLAQGLVARDAVDRATDALTALREWAMENKLDSEEQRHLRWFVQNAMRAPGITKGRNLAFKAIEALKLMRQWLRGQREEFIRRNRRRSVWAPPE